MSEQYLDNQGLCNLASILCSKFFSKENYYDKDKLQQITISVVRFLDNVITKEVEDERYATFEQKCSLENLRRIGAGVTDIAGVLFLNNFEYGSVDGNSLMENFQDDYNYFAYKYSIELGKEKGSFKAFDKKKYLTSGFIKQLIKRHPDLDFEYIRNVCLTSIAPTGTLSLMFRTCILSYGIEPAFGLYYWKRTRISGAYEYYFVVPAVVQEMCKWKGCDLNLTADAVKDTWDGKIGKEIAAKIDALHLSFKAASEVKLLDKLDLMARVQKNVDASISVTYQLPENSTWHDAYDLILEAYKREVKSIAAFPEKKMYGIVSQIPFQDLALKLKQEGQDIHPSNFSDKEKEFLGLIEETIKPSQNAPKRAKKLPADIYSIMVKGKRFIVAIGLLNNKPYEIFCGEQTDTITLAAKEEKGYIEKVKRGHYRLYLNSGVTIEKFSSCFKPIEQALFRTTSLALRHGTPVKFIVDTLNKSTDDMFSLTAAASRVLKKYIKNGEKLTGQTCPTCGSTELVYSEGCSTCVNCGNSKCS